MTTQKNNFLIWMLLESLERTGSLTSACIELDCDLATATRQIKRLEVELGIQLLDRKTKPIKPTNILIRNLPIIRRIIRLQDELYKSFETEKGNTPNNEIRFGLSTSSLIPETLRLINKFKEEYPEINVEFCPDMDHTSVIKQEVDVVLVPYIPREKTLTIMPIGRCLTLLVASPTYIEKHGNPSCIKELDGTHCFS